MGVVSQRSGVDSAGAYTVSLNPLSEGRCCPEFAEIGDPQLGLNGFYLPEMLLKSAAGNLRAYLHLTALGLRRALASAYAH